MHFPPPRNEENNISIDPLARLMWDYLKPTRSITPSCILLPVQAHAFLVKSGMLQLLPQFHGIERENPYLHTKEFEEIVATFVSNHAMEDIACMKLFPFFLNDKAKTWLNSLKPRSISSWTQMLSEFLKKKFGAQE